MAYQQLNVSANWPVSAQFTATGETQIRIVNSHGDSLFWITSPDDLIPNLPTGQASPIQGGQVQDVTLQDAERLWIAAPWLDGQIIDVTLMI